MADVGLLVLQNFVKPFLKPGFCSLLFVIQFNADALQSVDGLAQMTQANTDGQFFRDIIDSADPNVKVG